MKAYLLYLVGTVIFMDKIVTYVDIVYLRYFEDFEQIHDTTRGKLVWSTCNLSYQMVVGGR